MSVKHAKISFRTKTHDCQYCQYKSSRCIPETDISVNFCMVDMPKKVYQLRGYSASKCKELKTITVPI